MSRRPFIVALAVVILLTVIVTWPQAAHMGSKIAAHNDPHFSMWRLAWVAHAVRTDPHHVFDANIFYPEVRTLAYSDATLLEGAIAGPLLWAHVPLIVVYNVLLLGGIALSGLGMFVLVRYLTGSAAAALVSAAVFTMAPYRLEHFMHLELQWTMWMPLAFWAVHRATDEGSWKHGMLAGLFVWLQILSCVYYGIFLAMMVFVLAALLVIADVGRARAALPVLLLGAIAAAVLTLPYARPYMANVHTVGSRDLGEIARYSAQPLNYLASPPQNWLWAWTADRFGDNERRLFPGAIALLLALGAVAYRPARHVWVYAVMCGIAVELSFGMNGWLYRSLSAHIGMLHGLRAPARFAILASCALAVVSGMGAHALDRRLRRGARRLPVAALAVALLTIELAPSNMFLSRVANNTPSVYKILSFMPPGVLVELPMAEPGWLPGYDAVFEYWSTNHWHPLVNGYSGYYPPRFIQTISLMRTFPDDASIAHLRSLDVRYIIVHRAFYELDEYASLLRRMLQRIELKPTGRYSDPVSEAQIFELTR